MTTKEILGAFPRLKALVVGDICLDRWCTYDPATAEPSRETGIPRIGVVSVETTPGAGGTVANNLAALGAGEVCALGYIGEDGHGWELRRALAARGIAHELCVSAPGLPTFTYTKLINGATGVEDRPRVDFILTRPLPETIERRLIANLREAAPRFDAILVSDQAETDAGGVVTPAMRDALGAVGREYPDKVLWVDSRLRAEHFRNAIVKPNQQEAEAAARRVAGEASYQALREHIGTDLLVVTHGAQGVLLVRPEGETWVHTRPVVNPVDICGAGDSFSAGAALALAVTRDPAAAARFGNLVASVTIMKKGTGTASPEEVLEAEARG